MPRTSDFPIDPLFLRRWSPRAMSGESLSLEQVHGLLEAARWAPSSANGQPWRFVYALRGTPAFDVFLRLLNDSNRVWCVRAGAFLAVASWKHRPQDGRPAPSHAFDAGAAWMSLALQGTLSGLVVHAMLGFDMSAARQELRVPEDLELHCVVALGHPGSPQELPEHLVARESPSPRRPVGELCFEGRFSDLEGLA